MFLTLFTPTYNRKNKLERLYKSLCLQSFNDFEWLLIDDGSTDGTDLLVKEWIEEKKISIKYIQKKNGGKASAYNTAIKQIDGDLFTCVDSDDYLKDNALNKIYAYWKEEENEEVIGHIYKKVSNHGEIITKYNGNEKCASLNDFYRRYGLIGDTMLVYKSDIVKKYHFPSFDNEKFVPEAYIYDLYDREGVLRIFDETLYIVEYLHDGYSASIRKVNYDNPRGYEAFIKNRIKNDIELRFWITDMIRYIAIKFVLNEVNELIKCSERKMLTILLIPFGLFFYKKVYAQFE